MFHGRQMRAFAGAEAVDPFAHFRPAAHEFGLVRHEPVKLVAQQNHVCSRREIFWIEFQRGVKTFKRKVHVRGGLVLPRHENFRRTHAQRRQRIGGGGLAAGFDLKNIGDVHALAVTLHRELMFQRGTVGTLGDAAGVLEKQS